MDRKNGYWWSLDSKYIAFTQVDSSEIPLFRIMHQGKSSVGSEAQEDHAYPFAGASNVKVRLGIVSAGGGPITWMDLVCGGTDQANNEEEYLARVHWMHGNILIAQVLNRSHSKLKILKFDIKTRQRKTILVEEQGSWVNLHDCCKFIMVVLLSFYCIIHKVLILMIFVDAVSGGEYHTNAI